jgi:peroxiredoxin
MIMKKFNRIISLSTAIAASLTVSSVFALATVGQAAPELSLTDINGKAVKLSDFKGKQVVLEWTNPGCPFVQKHYDTNNMQGLQNKYDAKETVWLSVNSTAKSHQDYMSNDKLKAHIDAKKATPDAYLVDADGAAGKAYGAKTTPHMFVINPAGLVVYAGAIDDKPSANKADVTSAKNYVVAALDDLKAGKAVAMANTKPYGCSVKYQ